MSIYVLNIATMLGLALAIDYSLFLTSRFREELARGRTVEQAVERAVGTAGKAVLFSGVAVAIGLSGLLWFKASGLSSIGLGGAIVVLASVFYSLTFLPAILGMLGPRVNSLSVAGLLRRLGLRRDAAGRGPDVALGAGRARRHAPADPRPRPVLALLLVVGSPYLRLKQGVPDATVYPAGVASRDAWVALQTEFRAGETTPIVILARHERLADRARESIAAAHRHRRPCRGARRDRPGRGPVHHRRPRDRGADDGGPGRRSCTPRRRVRCRRSSRPVSHACARRTSAGARFGSTPISPLKSSEPAGTEVISRVREVALDPAISKMQVGGAAALGEDFLLSQSERIPWAVGTTLLASAVILFLLFGSLAIPIKAVVMTLLSLTASFGALVWIFQEGNLHELLEFEPLGYTIAGNPIIMFGGPDRAVDGLRGPAAVAHPGVLPAHGRQHRGRRRGPGADGGRHHRRGADHGHGVRRLRARRHGHDQEHRRGHGARRRARCHDRSRAARPRDDAAARALELVGARPARPARGAIRVQPRGRRRGPCRGVRQRRPSRARGNPPPRPPDPARTASAQGGGHAWTPRTTNRTPMQNTVPPASAPVHPFGWEWGREEDRRPQLPWIGIFLVVYGALPAHRAPGVAVPRRGQPARPRGGPRVPDRLAVRRGTFALYAGAFLTAAAIPDWSRRLNYQPGTGFGTLCYGVAFLFIAARAHDPRRRVGWQALIGVLLVVLGGSEMALPSAAELVLPILLVVLGLVLLTRDRSGWRRQAAARRPARRRELASRADRGRQPASIGPQGGRRWSRARRRSRRTAARARWRRRSCRRPAPCPNRAAARLAAGAEDRLGHAVRARERRVGLAVGDQLQPDQQARPRISPTLGWSPRRSRSSDWSRSPFVALASTRRSSSRIRRTSPATAAPTA